MSANDNCFLLTIKNNVDTESKKEEIKKYIYKLFRNKTLFGDDSFDEDSDVPFDIYFGLRWQKRKTVCLSLTSRSKVNVEKFSNIIQKILENSKLILQINDIVLNKPVKMSYCDLDRIKKKKGDIIWDTLEHNGPYFKHIYEPYERHNAPLIYDAIKYILNDVEEEMATFYARRIITEKTSVKKFLNKKQFNDNFFSDFKKYLTKEHKNIFKSFDKIDFSLIVNKLEKMKEEKEKKKKEKNKQEKDLERVQKLEKKLDYSFAYVNGIKKEVRNPSVEIPGLYIGQGNILTNKGRIKGFVNPKDVIINVSKNNEPLPPKGHKWGGVVHDNKASWIAKYKDTITGKDKYILLSDSGELFKYEKARKLDKFINVIIEKIDKLLKSDSLKDRQIGVIVYLVMNFGIRIGTEKDDKEDSNDDSEEKVVGATTLMVNNIILNDENMNNKIDLRFYGKDSVLYDNTIHVDPIVYKNIQEFIRNKGSTSLVFDKVSASDVNNYLKGIDRDFSAKVFRTRLASNMMHNGLKQYDLGEDATDDEKINFFTKVNKDIAIKLNHKKGITDAQKNSLKKDQDELDELNKKFKKDKDKKLKDKINLKTLKLDIKKDKLGVALDTSKKNYIDPRIIKAWCEDIDLAINKVYNTKSFQKYFNWVIEDDTINSDWNYMDTELDCIVGNDLSPKFQDNKEKNVILPSRYPEKENKGLQKVNFDRKTLDEKTKDDLIKIINLLGLPIDLKNDYTKKELIEYILSSKKSSRSPRKSSRSSRSPRKSSRSPRKSSRSPRKSSRSPRKSSRSPRKSSRSPRKSSRSPRKSSRSSHKSSRSPRKSSRSSHKSSRSPRKSSRSPRKSSRSSHKSSRSPRKSSRSPRKSSRSSQIDIPLRLLLKLLKREKKKF
jgi:DNA topoisomerase-1